MDTVLEITGFIIGLFYLWWEYHADTRVWLASMIMPMISMYLYFSKGLYADFGINIYYFLIAVYGYIAWKKGTGHTDPKPRRITHTPAGVWCAAAAALAVLWICMAWLLSRYTNSTVPVTDAFTTSLSIVAMWMMARKYAEQWLLWMVVDIVSAGLYIYKGLIFYPVLYAVYTMIAVFGYRKWLRLMHSENNAGTYPAREQVR